MNTQDLIKLFRKNGYKATSQRLAICKLIFLRKDHPSADQIYQELKEEHPTISLTTIYNTLRILVELRLLQELGFNEGSIRYDPDLELHINLVCSKCGKIDDYKAENVTELWNAIISNLDVKPIGQRIDLYYECEECK